MAVAKKTNEADFILISSKTKMRIKGLIEKKVTPQTITLFAQEYEVYDVETRLEIAEYISFIMEKELEIFMSSVKTTQATSSVVHAKMKQREFEEKQQNIKRIQDLLVKKETNITPKHYQGRDNILDKKNILGLDEQRQVVAAKPEKPSKPKVETKKEKPAPKKPASKPAASKPAPKSNISQLLKDAEEREQKQKAAELAKKEAEKAKLLKEKEKAKKEADAKKAAAAKKKAEKKPAPKKATATKTTKDPNEEYLAKQQKLVDQKDKEAKEYARREAEKEKLWKELYGKSREDSQKERDQSKQVAPKKGNENKTPSFKTIEIKQFVLDGNIYSIDEITDPKSRLYLFWLGIKQKFKVHNLFTWLDNLPLRVQQKLQKRRMKWLSRIPSLKVSPEGKTVPSENKIESVVGKKEEPSKKEEKIKKETNDKKPKSTEKVKNSDVKDKDVEVKASKKTKEQKDTKK